MITVFVSDKLSARVGRFTFENVFRIIDPQIQYEILFLKNVKTIIFIRKQM